MKDVLYRRDFPKAVGAATVVGSVRGSASPAVASGRTDRPNVVLVMTDGQGESWTPTIST